MSIICKEYTVRFVTPAFLGDAEQKGAWRTPPIKALLRQWWRVVVAKQYGYDWNEVRKKEGWLFGHAWLEDRGKKWAMKSQVQLTLSKWERGGMSKLPSSGQVCHPEVSHENMPACPNGRPGKLVEANLYLGFGPVGIRGLAHERAISPEESVNLSICYPDEAGGSLNDVLELIQVFGTLGGRSRNGWGSIVMAGHGMKEQKDIVEDLSFTRRFGRALRDCLMKEWPHALGVGEDDRLLLWKTPTKKTYLDIMKILADTKITFRTSLKFVGKPGMEDRHLLSYPVTNHRIPAWGNDVRIPNQLRFKVITEGENGYIGVVCHLPCGLPRNLQPSLSVEKQIEIWNKVHSQLDKALIRIESRGANP